MFRSIPEHNSITKVHDWFKKAPEMGLFLCLFLSITLCLNRAFAQNDTFDLSVENADGFAQQAYDCEQRLFSDCVKECSSSNENDLGRFRCTRQCLYQRCPVKEQDSFITFSDGESCLRSRSKSCVEKCGDSREPQEARCRRSCLVDVCGSYAESVDIAEEASSPGRTECRTCERSAEEDCKDICMFSSSGAAALACKVSCRRFRCAKECQKERSIPSVWPE